MKRTLEQNKWLRMYVAKASEHFGYKPLNMYELLMYKFNPVYLFDTNNQDRVRIPGHFSDLTIDEANLIIHKIKLWGMENGFILHD